MSFVEIVWRKVKTAVLRREVNDLMDGIQRARLTGKDLKPMQTQLQAALTKLVSLRRNA